MNPLPLVTALKRDDIDVVGVSGAVPGLDGDVNRDATESLFSRPAPLLLLRLLPMRLFSVKSLKRSGSAAVMHTDGGTTGATDKLRCRVNFRRGPAPKFSIEI